MLCHPVNGIGSGCLPVLHALGLLPHLRGFRALIQLPIAKNMGMTKNEFAAGCIAHIVKIKAPRVRLNSGVKNDLHQQITQFLSEMVRVLFIDGLADLIGLF